MTASFVRASVLLVCLLLMLTGAARAAGPTPAEKSKKPVTITIRVPTGVEPATLAATIHVEPDAANRVLRVVIESDEFYRSSDLPLDGAAASQKHTIRRSGLPKGNYCVSALVHRNTGQLVVTTARYRVIGADDSLPFGVISDEATAPFSAEPCSASPESQSDF